MDRIGCGLLCVVCWMVGPHAGAETIKWFSLAGSTNLTGSSRPMSASFNFELGVFKGSFVPTVANVAQWTANWEPAQRAAYSGTNEYFESQFTVANNIAPFTVGKAAYVWGFQTETASSEWILFRNPEWTWPAPNPMNPFGLDWDAATATALIGSINASGSPFLMKSAAVTSWQQWQATELAGEPLNGPQDDPDLDGQIKGTPKYSPGSAV